MGTVEQATATSRVPQGRTCTKYTAIRYCRLYKSITYVQPPTRATSAYPTHPSPAGGGMRIYLYKKFPVEEGYPVKFCCFEVCPIPQLTSIARWPELQYIGNSNSSIQYRFQLRKYRSMERWKARPPSPSPPARLCHAHPGIKFAPAPLIRWFARVSELSKMKGSPPTGCFRHALPSTCPQIITCSRPVRLVRLRESRCGRVGESGKSD